MLIQKKINWHPSFNDIFAEKTETVLKSVYYLAFNYFYTLNKSQLSK